MRLLEELVSDGASSRRRRRDAVDASRAILDAESVGARPELLPALETVDLVLRACCPDVASNTDVVRSVSAFVDPSPLWTLSQAADAGLWSLVQRIASRDHFDAVDASYRQWVYTKALASAAAAGRLDMVQFLSTRFLGCCVTQAVEEAASRGHLEILQWLHEHHENVQWGADELLVALRCNQAETASWLFTNVPSSRRRGRLMASAVASGDLSLVQWAFVNDSQSPDPLLLQNAVATGSLKLVKWLVESGIPEGPGARNGVWLDAAATAGHLELVKWLTVRGIGRCSEKCVEQAGANGHLEAVQWIVEHRSDGHGSEPMDEIAGRGRLEIVRWLVKHLGACFSPSAMDMAASNGHLDVVIFLHECQEFDFGCSYSAMNDAAGNGHLDIVKWLYRHRTEGCTRSAMDLAAANGHLDVVKWLHDNRTEGCTTWAMNFAAMYGHLHVAKWLHQHRSEGCTHDAMRRAIGNGHVEVATWLHENLGEPIPAYSIVQASKGGHLDMLKWIRRHSQRDPCSETLCHAIDSAAGNGWLSTARWLAATYTDARCSTAAVDKAARNGLFDMVIVLQSEFDGARVSEDTFASAIKGGELEIVQWLCRRFPDHVNRSRSQFDSLDSSPYIRRWWCLEHKVSPEAPHT